MSTAVHMPSEPPTPPWTEQQLETIKNYVVAGCSIPVAAEAAGVRWTTAKHWLSKGKAGVDPYTTFSDAMRHAQALHKAAANLIVMSAAKRGDWRAAAWIISRREMAEERQRQAQLPPTPESEATAVDDDRVVLLYPVPMPEGADMSQLQLAPGHAIDTEGQDVTKPNEGDDDDED